MYEAEAWKATEKMRNRRSPYGESECERRIVCGGKRILSWSRSFSVTLEEWGESYCPAIWIAA